MDASSPAGPLRLDDAAAVAVARPDMLVSADDSAAAMLAERRDLLRLLEQRQHCAIQGDHFPPATEKDAPVS